MDFIKILHISSALISISGFIIRGIWMMSESNKLQQKWVKIAPHIVDSLLLLSGITLAINLTVNPLEHAWLMSKIIALLVYIGLGMIALRFGKNLFQRKFAWVLAIVVFSYILLVAVTKHSMPVTF